MNRITGASLYLPLEMPLSVENQRDVEFAVVVGTYPVARAFAVERNVSVILRRLIVHDMRLAIMLLHTEHHRALMERDGRPLQVLVVTDRLPVSRAAIALLTDITNLLLMVAVAGAELGLAVGAVGSNLGTDKSSGIGIVVGTWRCIELRFGDVRTEDCNCDEKN